MRVDCCARAIRRSLEARPLQAVSRYLPLRLLHQRLQLRRLLLQKLRSLPFPNQQRHRGPHHHHFRRARFRRRPRLLSSRRKPLRRNQRHLLRGLRLPQQRNQRQQLRTDRLLPQRNPRPRRLCIAPRSRHRFHQRSRRPRPSQACRQQAGRPVHRLRRVNHRFKRSRKNRPRQQRTCLRSQQSPRRASLQPTLGLLHRSAMAEPHKSTNRRAAARKSSSELQQCFSW